MAVDIPLSKIKVSWKKINTSVPEESPRKKTYLPGLYYQHTVQLIKRCKRQLHIDESKDNIGMQVEISFSCLFNSKLM